VGVMKRSHWNKSRNSNILIPQQIPNRRQVRV
jgi:hypothetical protein